MATLAESRNWLAYKLQLSDLPPKDFFVANDKIQQWEDTELLQYVKPDLRQQYWHDIAKRYIQDRPQNSNSHLYVLNRLCDHYEDTVLPLLQSTEWLHESSDWLQQQTSRIVRIPNLDDSDTTFWWLLSQHTPQNIVIKDHQYKDNYTRVQFYWSKSAIIKELSKQQWYLDKQIKRFSIILERLPDSVDSCKLLYRESREEFDMMIDSIKLNTQYGKTKADDFINKLSIPTNHSFNTRNKIRGARRRLEEQLRKAEIMIEKNNLHIKSLQKYNM